MTYLTVRTRSAGGTLVVYIDGYLNSLLGEEIERVVRDCLDGGGRRVLMNFAGTRLINSIGISIIIGIVETIGDRQGVLGFCCLSRINRELFRMTGVDPYFRSFDSEEEAIASLNANA